jgi:FlaA1/EpsC-like NDP-sugar epimerase
MARLLSRWTQLAIDLFVLAVAFGVAFLLRFERDIPAQMFKRMLFLWPYVVSFQYLTLLAFGVHRFVWRYVGLREALRIFAAAGTAAVALLGVRLLAGFFFDILQGPAQYASVPIGVIAADAVLVALGVSGVRIVRRLQTERAESLRRGTGAGPKLPTLLIGAGP